MRNEERNEFVIEPVELKLEFPPTKEQLEILIKKHHSQRTLAKIYGCSKRTIEKYLAKFGLQTDYMRYKQKKKARKKRPKINMEIAKDFDNSLWLDFTDLTVRSGKHKASSKILALTVFYGNHREAFIMERKDKTKIMTIVAKLVKKYKPSQILADKEFHYLNELIPTRKSANWNCSKQFNEKVHGLKTLIYQYLLDKKETYGLSYEQLLSNKLMVLNAYLEILPIYGFRITIVDRITINPMQITSKPIIQ